MLGRYGLVIVGSMVGMATVLVMLTNMGLVLGVHLLY
jgi:uncharacterized membrane protein SpoIIM required for sporulation